MVTFQLWLFGVGASSGLGCMRLVGAPLKRSGRGRGAGAAVLPQHKLGRHLPATPTGGTGAGWGGIVLLVVQVPRAEIHARAQVRVWERVHA